MPATLWRSRPIQLIRAVGWLSLLPDRLEWQPLVRTPFFPPVSIPIEQIRRAIVGGIFIGPDLRIDTEEGTLRFTVGGENYFADGWSTLGSRSSSARSGSKLVGRFTVKAPEVTYRNHRTVRVPRG